jgi:hypothetical protein
MPQENPFDQFQYLYRTDPVRMVREVWGAQPDGWQEEFLNALARGERRISVRSGHRVGKSTAASWASIWFLLCRYRCKVAITSQSATQLFDALFSEIVHWIHELPPQLRDLLNIKSSSIELASVPSDCFLTAGTSRPEAPEALAGKHSDFVLLIADEASGIPEQVFEAASSSMAGHNAQTVLLGNPVRTSGFFYDTHHKNKTRWYTMHVSGVDSPRVSRDYIQDALESYGEDSNYFRVRILGEFPRVDEDTVIPIELVQAAVSRDVVPSQFANVVWGLDIARFGSDCSALCKRRGNAVTEPIRTWHGKDLMQTVGLVMAEWETTPLDKRPIEILVDSIGLGAGACDRLAQLGLPARGINVSESPAVGNTFVNLRAELWFKAKAWFEKRDCLIPNDDRLIGELSTIRYGFQEKTGKLKIESKEDMKRRGLRSPDAGDSFILSLASDSSTALYGTAAGNSWSRKLVSRLQVV